MPKINTRDNYWDEIERNERRTIQFNRQFNNPCFGIGLILMCIICCPCICYDKFKKVHPEND